MKKVAGQLESTTVDTLIVGAGIAGIFEALRLKREHPAESILLIDADDRPLGRALNGLHLVGTHTSVDAGWPQMDLSAKTYGPAKIRWEKKWLGFDEIDWAHNDWIASLPQWSAYLRDEKKIFQGLSAELMAQVPKLPAKVAADKTTGSTKSKKGRKESDDDDTLTPSWLVFNEAVSQVERLEETSHYSWRAYTSNRVIVTKKVVWAAGITAFQNAFGKIESQSFLTGNPFYQKEAADYAGGLSLDVELNFCPEFEAGFDRNSVFALPVRHNSKLSLMVGVVEEVTPNQSRIRTLTHVHHDLLTDPKELLSYQKSLRRSIKHILSEESAALFEQCPEKWVVSPKIGAHMLGNPWCFRSTSDDQIEFIGDQAFDAMSSCQMDVLGALSRFKTLTAKKAQTSEALL